MTEVEKAKAFLNDAITARKALEGEIRSEVEKVKASFYSRSVAAERAVGEAEQQLRVAQNEAVTPHEWEGKTVTRREYEMKRWASGRTGKYTDFTGVVFTYRNGDQLGRGQWGNVGQAHVRLIKKDGTPGLKTERLASMDYHSAPECRWHLIEDASK